MEKENQTNLIVLDENDYYRKLPRGQKMEIRENVCRKMQIKDYIFLRKIAGTTKVTQSDIVYYKQLVTHYENVRKDRILQLS